MANKIPINVMLDALDRQDFNWYSNLTSEEKKSWSSWLTLRYASSVKGSGSGDALLATNEFVNKHYTDLYKSDDLMWRLMCLTGTGKKQYHEWIKPPTSKRTTDKVSEFIQEQYPHFKSDDIEMFQMLNSVSDIKQMAIDSGIDDKRIDEIFGKKKGKKK